MSYLKPQWMGLLLLLAAWLYYQGIALNPMTSAEPLVASAKKKPI